MKLNIGIVCPYGWDTPGGVQIHIKELAEWLIKNGHQVSVLAPVTDDSAVAEKFVVSAGRPIPIRFNGSVARVLFGPLASSRVKQWIENGNFDLMHIHEPAIPSIGLLAGWAGDGALVATFHASTTRLRAFNAIATALDPLIERISGKIAVSEIARETLKERFNTEAVVIPNGIHISKFDLAQANPEWSGQFNIGFLGRFNESRKGLDILIKALPEVLLRNPQVKLLVAGPGDIDSAKKDIPKSLQSHVEFLGPLTEAEKISFFKSLTLYIAPNTGGESFGIILAEAMACHTPIVASDLPAFESLLDGGKNGLIFKSGDSGALALAINDLLGDQSKRAQLAQAGFEKAKELDWEKVASAIFGVYELAISGGKGVQLTSDNRIWNRFRFND
jgi:phosphatidyl-myo-inositol alpha-mannosyltransferase